MKLFVWDFHGVLEKDNEKAVVEITNIVLAQRGYKKRITLKKCHQLYGLKWWQYFEKLLPLLKHREHLKLQNLCIKTQLQYPSLVEKHIKQNDNVEDVLYKIKKGRNKQIIISNTKLKSLKIFTKIINISKDFSASCIFSSEKALGKKQILKKFLKNKKFDKIVIIGDTPSDIELSSICKATTYLYSHPWKKFPKCEADYQINNLKMILNEL